MTFHVLGYTFGLSQESLQMIVTILQGISAFVAIAVALGVAAHVRRYFRRRTGYRLNQFIVSSNQVGKRTENGTRPLTLRNLDQECHLTDAIIPEHLHALMLAGAKRCSGKHPFVVIGNEKLQQEFLHAVRNYLTRFTLQGELDYYNEIPHKEIRILFAVTSSDGSRLGDVRKFRVIWITENDLSRCCDTGTTLTFEDGQDHQQRAFTLAKMKHSWFHRDGRLSPNAKGYAPMVVGTLKMKVRI